MLATKFASSSNAHTIHAPRARVSHLRGTRLVDVRADQGCDCVPGGDIISVLLVYATGKSFHREEDLNYPGAGFYLPQHYHSIPPSRNRYEKRYERSDLRNCCKSSHPHCINNFEFFNRLEPFAASISS